MHRDLKPVNVIRVPTARLRVLAARWWVKLMGLIAPVVGPDRAIEWALRGAKRAIRAEVVR